MNYFTKFIHFFSFIIFNEGILKIPGINLLILNINFFQFNSIKIKLNTKLIILKELDMANQRRVTDSDFQEKIKYYLLIIIINLKV